MIVDLFAGPGGWEEGLALLGMRGVIGYEIDEHACCTRDAAGHETVREDVAGVHLTASPLGDVEGLVASPPCPAFSSAGRREGVADLPLLHTLACSDGHWGPAPLVLDHLDWQHEESRLVLEPLRWAYVLRPRWLACEQVREVLPFWRTAAATLQRWGYRTWAGILNAANYGVPQTRRRAILLASLDRQPHAPHPTHHDPRKGQPLFGRPWVSMAEALGWNGALVGSGYGTAKTTRSTDEPAPTVAFGNDAAAWELHTSRDVLPDGASQTRSLEQPAPTVTGGRSQWTVRTGNRTEQGGGKLEMYERSCDEPAPTLDTAAGRKWVIDRPATTVCGDPRLAAPGHRDREGGEPQFGEGSVKITVQQAAILQGFRPDYPWQGTRTAQFQQVGNAVPPPLAAAVLRVLEASAAVAS